MTEADLQRLREPLKRMFRAYGCTKEDADDLTQETLIRACRRFGSYRAEKPLLNWVMRIGGRLFLDSKRKQLCRVPVIGSLDDPMADGTTFAEVLPDHRDRFTDVDAKLDLEAVLDDCGISIDTVETIVNRSTIGLSGGDKSRLYRSRNRLMRTLAMELGAR